MHQRLVSNAGRMGVRHDPELRLPGVLHKHTDSYTSAGNATQNWCETHHEEKPLIRRVFDGTRQVL